MVDQETQDKLDKLKRLEGKARERSKAWMDKIKADGKKQISAIVTAKVFNEICLRRDRSTLTGKPLTTGDVIEQALFPDIDAKPKDNGDIKTNVSLDVPLNIDTNVNSDTKEGSPNEDAEKPVDDEPLSEMEPPTAEPSEEPQSEIPGPTPKQDTNLPDYLIDVNPNMPIEERDKIVLRLKKDFPKGKGIAQKRIDMLNGARILLDGKLWEDTKQFSDQLTCARRRAKNRANKS